MKGFVWVLIFTVLFLPLFSFGAIQFSQAPRTSDYSDAYIYENILRCDEESSEICVSVCVHPSECRWTAEMCLSCAGGQSALLRTLFTKLDSYFQRTESIGEMDLARYLERERYVYLDAKSAFNFFRPWEAEDVRANFLRLCPSGSVRGGLLVRLDGRDEPAEVDLILCEQFDGATQAYGLRQQVVSEGMIENQVNLNNP